MHILFIIIIIIFNPNQQLLIELLDYLISIDCNNNSVSIYINIKKDNRLKCFNNKY